jgi:hypothetical protein
LVTRDEVAAPIRSAYAVTKPEPASPIGNTDASAADNQPEAITSPACREDSGPMESVAIRMRTLGRSFLVGGGSHRKSRR